WQIPSLCAGWQVREVVAHLTMPFRYSAAKFMTELVRSGGKFNRMADRCARRDAGAETSELLAALRDNEWHPWKPPRCRVRSRPYPRRNTRSGHHDRPRHSPGGSLEQAAAGAGHNHHAAELAAL